MWRFSPVKWSPVEVDYLKAHKDMPISQLTIALSKSNNAIKNKLTELRTGKKPKTTRGKKGTKIGKRKDLKLFVRSGWEADVVRWLNHKAIKWEYEPKIFTYIEFGYKHGTLTYTPDIKVYNFSSNYDYQWIEVKGFLKAEDKVKLRRFKKYYPDEFEKLTVICGSKSTATYKWCIELGVKEILEFNQIRKDFKDIIKHWES